VLYVIDALPSILDGGQDDLHGGKLAVNSKEEDETEEDCGPDLRIRHLGQSVGEDNEDEAGAVSHHLVNLLALLVREVAEDGEHCAAAHEADASVHHRHDQGVAEDGTTELVVAAKRDQRTESYSNGVENLGSCIDPNFWFTNFMPVRQEKEFEPIDRSWQCYSSDDKREEENDRQSCRDVDHFAGSCHTLPQAEVDYHPGESQEAKQLQSHFSHVMYPIGHLQNSVIKKFLSS